MLQVWGKFAEDTFYTADGMPLPKDSGKTLSLRSKMLVSRGLPAAYISSLKFWKGTRELGHEGFCPSSGPRWELKGRNCWTSKMHPLLWRCYEKVLKHPGLLSWLPSNFPLRARKTSFIFVELHTVFSLLSISLTPLLRIPPLFQWLKSWAF